MADDEDGDQEKVASTGAIDPMQVLDVSPTDLRFQCLLNTEVSYTLTLRNISTSCVAFKVKTTAPRRYCVRPTQGCIQQGDQALITIVLMRISVYPDQSNPRNLRDKFLVQSLAIAQDLVQDDLSALWSMKERQHNPKVNQRAYFEDRLKCRLVIPPPESPTAAVRPHALQTHDSANVPTSAPSIVVTPPLTSPDAKQQLSPPPPAPDATVVAAPSSAPVVDVAGSSVGTATAAPVAASSEPAARPASVSTSSADMHTVVPQSSIPKASAPRLTAHASSPAPTSTPKAMVRPAIPEASHPAPQAAAAAPTPASAVATTKMATPRIASKTAQDFSDMIDKPREYEKMLAYSVKLTAEREAIEAKLFKLRDQNEALVRENDILRKAIESSSSTRSSPGVGGPDGTQFSVLDALGENGLRHRGATTSMAQTPDQEAALAAAELSIGAGIQFWQVILLATICFLLGRIL